MKSLKDYILNLLAKGKCFFTKQEAIAVLALNETQFRFQAYRLSQKKMIKRLIADFFMIIPAEYRNLGSLPPLWIVDSLMNYLGLSDEYYVGLLSAASLYGSTEQQPMVMQIIVGKKIRAISLKRSNIEFHQSKQCATAQMSVLNVATGSVKVSVREQTIVDLVKFYKVAGYLSNVALVIKSLASEASNEMLKLVVEREQNEAALQRLGYILDYVGFPVLADIVENHLATLSTKYVYLRPDHYVKKGVHVKRWKIIENDYLEVA